MNNILDACDLKVLIPNFATLEAIQLQNKTKSDVKAKL